MLVRYQKFQIAGLRFASCADEAMKFSFGTKSKYQTILFVCVENAGRSRMAETAFSSIKRMFGEHVTARKFPYMVKEIILKAALYNMFNHMA